MNPLLEPYISPFGIPPFEIIRTHHFKPALQEGMDLQNKKVNQIAESLDHPTFENTIETFEASGKVLQKVKNVFFNYTLALTDDELQEVAKEMAPLLSQHWDNIKLNEKLFDKVKSVWEQRDSLQLNKEKYMLLKNTYDLFFKNGAALTDKDKKELKEINEKISLLSLKFGRNVLAENNRYQLIIERESDMSGLPESFIQQAKVTADECGLSGKWVFTLHQSSVMSFLQYAEDRGLRREIWEAYQNRGNNEDTYDNKDIVIEVVNLRRKKAQLLGFNNFAAFVLEDTMAGSEEEVYRLLNKLWLPAIKRAESERAAMQKYIDQHQYNYKLAPWDWRFFAEKIRIEKFDLDINELLPYFSLEVVIDGVFMVTDRLYGLQFEIITHVPVYHPDVIVYDVKEKNGDHIGILFMDFYTRNTKQGGAWMTKYRAQELDGDRRVPPIISIVCNFSKPSIGTPLLLNLDEVATLFHEFGHALHGLLSNVRYQSLAGTAVPRDFVELPSQIMENWAMDPEVMQDYAIHFKTGKSIPKELLEKIKISQLHDQGFANAEFLAAALLDLAYHSLDKDITGSIIDFEEKFLKSVELIEEIIPRYRSTYFNHIFSGGYASQYYSYIWAAVLDADAYQSFRVSGLYNKEISDAFRKNILEKGGSEEAMEMYLKFKGTKPDIKSLLEKRGLH